MLRTSNCELDGAGPGLDGRAHVDRGARGSIRQSDYMAAAFPSACGKTNLSMMVSALEKQGYRVWTLGDDIAWMQTGPDGYLHAINPETGFFGVAPGTNLRTNPNVMAAVRKNTIFTKTP